jgi:hypothetical protein
MPGPVSESSRRPSDRASYAPSWCYANGPQVCPCGHHEGYHNDAGACLLASECGCGGIPPHLVTPLESSDTPPGAETDRGSDFAHVNSGTIFPALDDRT